MQLPRTKKGEPIPEWPPGTRADWYKAHLEEIKPKKVRDLERRADIVIIALYILLAVIFMSILITAVL